MLRRHMRPRDPKYNKNHVLATGMDYRVQLIFYSLGSEKCILDIASGKGGAPNCAQPSRLQVFFCVERARGLRAYEPALVKYLCIT